MHSNWLFLYAFLRREMLFLKRDFVSFCLDASIGPAGDVVNFIYIFPLLGMTTAFAPFVLIGGGVATVWHRLFVRSFNDVADFDGVKSFTFLTQTPTHFSVVLLAHVLAAALSTSTFLVLVPIFGKILMWNVFDLSHFSIIKYIVSLVAINITFACFCLWFSSWACMYSIMSSRVRLMDPLFFLGAFLFNWHTMYKAVPVLGIAMLANPVVHAMESIRSAIQGPVGLIPFWYSIMALVVVSVVTFFVAKRNLVKRLDLVV